MNMKDRTAEFYALAERIKKRGNTKNRNSPVIDKRNASITKTRSEFSRLAAQLGRNIAATSEKLEQLTYCKLVVFFLIGYYMYATHTCEKCSDEIKQRVQ